MSRTPIRFSVLLIACLVVGWLVYSKVSASSVGGDSGGAGGSPSAELVTTHVAEPNTLYDTLGMVGTLEADESITVRNEVPGTVVSIDFEEGQRVSRGDRLLQMRSEVLRAELKAQQRGRDMLQTEADRQERVLDQGGIPEHQYDMTVSELEVAEAEIDRIRARIDETVVRAPFDGVIGLRDVSRGAVLPQGGEIAELRKVDELDLEFTVPERFANRIEEGRRLLFRTHGSDDIHSAEITVVEPGLDPGNRTLRVRADVDNSDGAFRAGSFAQIRLVLEEFEDVLTVPSVAVVTSSEGASVWLNEDGEAVRQPIEIGFRNEARVQVVDGLEPGDEVVVTGRSRLAPGTPLQVDDSDTAMDVSSVGPDSTTSGMRNQLFSETGIEEALRARAAESPSDEEAESDGDDASGDDGEAQ